MATAKLIQHKMRAALSKGPLSAWADKEGESHRKYRFGSFADAFGIMTSLTKGLANPVPHDACGISLRNFELAGRIEPLAAGKTKI